MKKLLISLLTLTTVLVTSITPSKSEAAVFMASGTIFMADFEDIDGAAMTIGSALATIGVAVLGIHLIKIPGHCGYFKILGGLLLALDADGALPQKKLNLILANQFPFIDNTGIVDNLSNAIKQKYEMTEKKDQTVTVALQENEVREILSPINLNEEQIKAVVTELGPIR